MSDHKSDTFRMNICFGQEIHHIQGRMYVHIQLKLD